MIHLFQVRNLPKPRNKYSNKKYLIEDFDNFLINIEKKIKKLTNKNPPLPGKNTIFSKRIVNNGKFERIRTYVDNRV